MDELQKIEKLIQDLSKADREDDDLFRRLICRTAFDLRLRDEDFSKMFSISRPSVSRWKNARSSPHPLMRRQIYELLGKRAKECLQDLRALKASVDRAESDALAAE